MKNYFSKDVIICRYRLGDEFAIIFPDKGKEEVSEELLLLCNHFNDYTFSSLPDEYINFCIRFSYGISDINSRILHLDDLLLQAEAELANAKKVKLSILI